MAEKPLHFCYFFVKLHWEMCLESICSSVAIIYVQMHFPSNRQVDRTCGLIKGWSMSLSNNFNHQIYSSDLPVLFMARKKVLLNKMFDHAKQCTLGQNRSRTGKTKSVFLKLHKNRLSQSLAVKTTCFTQYLSYLNPKGEDSSY